MLPSVRPCVGLSHACLVQVLNICLPASMHSCLLSTQRGIPFRPDPGDTYTAVLRAE